MSSSAPSLPDMLAEEINSFGQFCLLLQQEREALASMDQDQLDILVSRKQMLCEHLTQLASQRQQAAAVDTLHADPEVARDWHKLLALAREARELNQINGTIIETRMQHNQQAMAVLKVGDEVSATYSADGLNRSGSNARHLGSA